MSVNSIMVGMNSRHDISQTEICGQAALPRLSDAGSFDRRWRGTFGKRGWIFSAAVGAKYRLDDFQSDIEKAALGPLVRS